jgi:Flp pilus assembly pilin Flp
MADLDFLLDVAPRTAAARQPLILDRRGAAMSEYLMLLGIVSLGAAAALAALGPGLLSSFEQARAVLIAPIP